MAKSPRVSVAMTVRDGEAFVDAAVRAALAMDYPDLEVIVVDDGSTDRTWAILSTIEDPRLKARQVESVGRAQALNIAVETATGEFIAINDADDLSLPQRLAVVMPVFEAHPAVDLIGTGYHRVSTFPADLLVFNREPTGEVSTRARSITRWRLYRNCPFVHSTVVYRKSLWAAINGYDHSLPMCIDYDFFLRGQAARGGTFLLLATPTVLYYDHSGSHFKRRSPMEYLRTNLSIRRRTRRQLGLPVFAYILDLLQYYQTLRLLLKGWLHRRGHAT